MLLAQEMDARSLHQIKHPIYKRMPDQEGHHVSSMIVLFIMSLSPLLGVATFLGF